MIDRNAEIEQMIYTAGGRTKLHGNNGSFGVWSKTKGLDSFDLQNAISEITNVLKAGVESDYARQTIRKKVLKEGATPSGLFKKSYKDSDYEEQSVVIREAITILQQSKTGALRGDYEDFRATPEKAPFRIGATKLPDGRLLVVRVGQINRVYSEIDNRTGNFFAHSLLFPQGANIEDINLESLDWQYGLEDKYWKGQGIMAPDYLETTSLNKMSVNLQRKSATTSSTKESINRTLTEQDLLDLYKLSVSERDPIKRKEYKKQFAGYVQGGANLVAVRKLAYVELLNAHKAGKPTIDLVEIAGNLEREFCKFDDLFDDFSTISSDTRMTYQQQKQMSEQLKWKLSRCDMSVITKFAQSQKELFEIKREYERLTNSNKTESEFTKKGVDNSFRFVTYCQGVLQMQEQEGMEQ